MRAAWNIAKSGIDAARANPERHVATLLCLTLVLVPYLTGLCAIRGRRSVESCEWRVAADLIVEGRRAGRRCLVPVAVGAALSELPGVERVTPQLAFTAWAPESDAAVRVSGCDASVYDAPCATGAWFANDFQCTLGAALAQRWRARVGDVVRLRAGVDARSTLELRVSGVLSSRDERAGGETCHVSWSTADELAGGQNLASRFLIRCTPHYESALIRQVAAREFAGLPSGARWRIDRRDALEEAAAGRSLRREGIWTYWFAPAFAAALLAISVTSGFALDDRRREVALLKSSGWSTSDVVLRAASELTFVSLTAALLSVCASAVWSEAWGGAGIAAWAAGSEAAHDLVASDGVRWHPGTAALAGPICLTCGLTGSIYAVWRAASAPCGVLLR